jgi:aryl-alcohol dehydrogenase-like predicted oxidoreductase
MGMSFAYKGGGDEASSLRVLHRSLELGVDFWDTAELYGPFANEELLGRALATVRREDVVIATKFAFRYADGQVTGLDSSPAAVRAAVEGSLRRLGTDYIDLIYQHRLDPATPIEETMGAVAALAREGKIRYAGLSEVGPGTIRRAHAVFPLSAVQTEYSLWERGVEEKVLPVLRELGIGLVAYSPLGRGFLTGRFEAPESLPEGDWRRGNPRFTAENFEHNRGLVHEVEEIGKAHGATPAQVALAWLLRQTAGGPGQSRVVPIPGTTRVKYLEQNAAAAALSLPESAWVALDRLLSSFRTAGARYPEGGMRSVDASE